MNLNPSQCTEIKTAHQTSVRVEQKYFCENEILKLVFVWAGDDVLLNAFKTHYSPLLVQKGVYVPQARSLSTMLAQQL